MFESNRKIIHIDMDAFFASVEQRDNPDLRGKPVAVGGSRERGVVAAASYEARKFGVRSALSSKIAYQKCPEIVFVPPNFESYKAVSKQVMEIFHRYTDLVEPLSLDEAYLDVSENKLNIPHATDIAKLIKQQIKDEIKLTASAGISYCKFLAKIASGYQKPDGLTIIKPNQALAFIEKLPIEEFFGIGKVTAEKMRNLQIFTGKDLKQLSLNELIPLFGIKASNYYFNIARGIDNRLVEPNRVRKSIGSEETYEHYLSTIEDIQLQLKLLAIDVMKRCNKSQATGKTVTLKIKYNDFVVTTRSKTIAHFVQTSDELEQLVEVLLKAPELPIKPVRLLGISLSNLNTDPDTKTVFQPLDVQLKLKLENQNQ